MAQTLCYIPGEKVLDPALWNQLRSWQKSQSLSVEKIRWTPDFLGSDQCNRDELAGALSLLRGGDIQRVVYFELRPRAAKDLDWLAFACSCLQMGIPVENAEGEALLTLEKAEVLQELFLKAASKSAAKSAASSSSKPRPANR